MILRKGALALAAAVLAALSKSGTTQLRVWSNLDDNEPARWAGFC